MKKTKEVWTSDRPIIELPKFLRLVFQEHANLLYSDLSNHKLIVVLGEAPNKRFEGHKVRVVEDYNPEWYRELFHIHPSLKRRESLYSLDRIRNLRDRDYIDKKRGFVPCLFLYDMIYRELICGNLIGGFVFEGIDVEPLEEVVRYFMRR